MKTTFFFILAFLLASCEHQSDNMGGALAKLDSSSLLEEADIDMELSTESEMLSDGNSFQNEGQDQPKKPAKKIIRTGQLDIEVESYKKAREQLDGLVKQYDAIVVRESENKYTYRIQNELTIRVLPEKFDAFIKDLEGLAFHLENKTISARDVTREFVDMETRLSAKRAIVKRYREILKSAKTITDILAVEENMRKVIEEIESIEGQLRYLGDQVQYSTLNVTIYENFDQPSVSRKSFWHRIGNALGDGWQVLLGLMVGLTSIWPLVIIMALIAFWVVKRIRRKKKKA